MEDFFHGQLEEDAGVEVVWVPLATGPSIMRSVIA
jgi:hypothetical protein